MHNKANIHMMYVERQMQMCYTLTGTVGSDDENQSLFNHFNLDKSNHFTIENGKILGLDLLFFSVQFPNKLFCRDYIFRMRAYCFTH